MYILDDGNDPATCIATIFGNFLTENMMPTNSYVPKGLEHIASYICMYHLLTMRSY